MTYRIVPKPNGRWGVEKLEQTKIPRWSFLRGNYYEIKEEWNTVRFRVIKNLEPERFDSISRANKIYYPLYSDPWLFTTFETESLAEKYIDNKLSLKKKEKRHMNTPPREYP